MFVATTESPKEEITLEQADENFQKLMARSSEYLKELESLGKIKNGSYLDFEQVLMGEVDEFIRSRWINS